MEYLTNKKVAEIKESIRGRKHYWDLNTEGDNLVQASTVLLETYHVNGEDNIKTGIELNIQSEDVPELVAKAKKYLRQRAVLGEFTAQIDELAELNETSIDETAKALLKGVYNKRKDIEDTQAKYEEEGKDWNIMFMCGLYEDAVLILAGLDPSKAIKNKYAITPTLDTTVEQERTEEDESTVVDQHPELYKLGKEILETPEKAVGVFFFLSLMTNALLLTYGAGKVAKYTIKGTMKVFKLGKYKPLSPLQHPYEESGVNYFWEAEDKDDIKPIQLDLTNSITTRNH